MAELVKIGPAAIDLGSDDLGITMNFYCWPCRSVHEFALAEVEQIVYALGAAEKLSYEVGRLDEAAKLPDESAEQVPQCLKNTLRDARNSEVFLEHVEQGVECREKADG